MFGVHASTKFSCVIVGVYASTSVSERQTLWNELTLLKSSFEVPMFLAGDFNENLHPSERSSGNLNVSGSKAIFKSFLSNYDLIEYPLAKHHYTWFRGRSMSRIDRDFAPSSSSILQYPSLTLTKYIP
jgi:hypothetical protein